MILNYLIWLPLKKIGKIISICTSFCIEHPGTWIYAIPGRDVTLRVYVCTLVFRAPAGGYFHRHIKPEYREARGFLWYAICLNNLYYILCVEPKFMEIHPLLNSTLSKWVPVGRNSSNASAPYQGSEAKVGVLIKKLFGSALGLSMWNAL